MKRKELGVRLENCQSLSLSVCVSLSVAQGAMVVLGSFMTFAGVLAYKYLFFKTSWRKIYLWSVVLTTFFSLLQLLLIFQVGYQLACCKLCAEQVQQCDMV